MEGSSFIVPHGQASISQAYICIPLDEEMASRSSVMATLADIGGIVELPSGMEISDVVRWAELKPKQVETMTTEELIDALQVNFVYLFTHAV